jgi:hypothetical protein
VARFQADRQRGFNRWNVLMYQAYRRFWVEPRIRKIVRESRERVPA